MPGLVFENLQRDVKVGEENLKYYDLSTVLPKEKYERLPFSIRVLLESAIRNCDNFQVRIISKYYDDFILYDSWFSEINMGPTKQ